MSVSTQADTSPIDIAERPFQQNLHGCVARLQLESGRVLFCDVLLLTPLDLVVTVPKAEPIPDRGERLRVSFFLTEDDSYVSFSEGIIHWEMALHGQRLAAIFLKEPACADLLLLAKNDRRGEVRYPANLACHLRNTSVALDARLINYSLNGVAIRSDKPLTVGDRYDVTLQADGDTVELYGICRWSVETDGGYVNGCSVTPGEGAALACRAFRGSVKPWDIGGTGAQATQARDDEEEEAVPSPTLLPPKALVSRSTILLLAAVLIGLSTQVPGKNSKITLLSGCVALVMYVALGLTARLREKCREARIQHAKRSAAERRLNAHLGRNAETDIE